MYMVKDFQIHASFKAFAFERDGIFITQQIYSLEHTLIRPLSSPYMTGNDTRYKDLFKLTMAVRFLPLHCGDCLCVRGDLYLL